MKQKTAMQKLKERLFDARIKDNPLTLEEINKLIEIERTQIEQAWNEGMINGYTDYDNSEDYLTQTYEQQ